MSSALPVTTTSAVSVGTPEEAAAEEGLEESCENAGRETVKNRKAESGFIKRIESEVTRQNARSALDCGSLLPLVCLAALLPGKTSAATHASNKSRVFERRRSPFIEAPRTAAVLRRGRAAAACRSPRSFALRHSRRRTRRSLAPRGRPRFRTHRPLHRIHRHGQQDRHTLPLDHKKLRSILFRLRIRLPLRWR